MCLVQRTPSVLLWLRQLTIYRNSLIEVMVHVVYSYTIMVEASRQGHREFLNHRDLPFKNSRKFLEFVLYFFTGFCRHVIWELNSQLLIYKNNNNKITITPHRIKDEWEWVGRFRVPITANQYSNNWRRLILIHHFVYSSPIFHSTWGNYYYYLYQQNDYTRESSTKVSINRQYLGRHWQ